MSTFQEMQHSTDVIVINEWRYLQLKHFVENLPQPIRTGEELMPLEGLCTAVNKRNNISKIYKILIEVEELEVPPYFNKWEKELGIRGKKHNIGKILTLTHSSAVDIRTINALRGGTQPQIKHVNFNRENPRNVGEDVRR